MTQTYFCTHCGKKNAIVHDDGPEVTFPTNTQIPPLPHLHDWFLCAEIEDHQIYDCGCGERKRVKVGMGNKENEVYDNAILTEGSVNRALIYK